jgi:hypothetical protein
MPPESNERKQSLYNLHEMVAEPVIRFDCLLKHILVLRGAPVNSGTSLI